MDRQESIKVARDVIDTVAHRMDLGNVNGEEEYIYECLLDLASIVQDMVKAWPVATKTTYDLYADRREP